MSPAEPTRDERAQRRAARRATRSTSPALSLPQTPPRLRWPPLSLLPGAADITHERALALLADEGVDLSGQAARYAVEAAGAGSLPTTGRLRVERDWLQHHLALAPTQFTWVARNPARSLQVGAGAIVFGLHGAARQVHVLEAGSRPAALADLRQALQLAQALGPIHVVGQPFAALSDVAAPDLALVTLEAALRLTDRPIMTRLSDGVTADDQLDLASAVVGRFDALDGPALLGDVSASGPLAWDAAATGALAAYARAGQALLLRPFAADAGGPDAWARQHAEVLFAIALAQAVRPGTPVIHGGLRGPQHGPAAAQRIDLGLQLARSCALPGQADTAAGAPMPGADAMAQTGWALWPAVLGGAALVAGGVGLINDGQTFSFEQALADVEHLAMFRHFLDGFVVEPATLALDDIDAAGPGGHHLETARTRAGFGDAFYPAFLSDRLAYETWDLAGGWDSARRAESLLLPEIRAASEPPALDPATESRIMQTLTRLRTRRSE